MTRNQIDWQNMKIASKRQREEARHNVAMEKEQQRANRVTESLRRSEVQNEIAKLEEVRRNNDLNYAINYVRNSEQARHNVVSELQERARDANTYATNSERNALQATLQRIQDENADLDRMVTLLRNSQLDSREVTRTQLEFDQKLRQYELDVKKAEAEIARWEAQTKKTNIEAVREGVNAARDIGSAVTSSIEFFEGMASGKPVSVQKASRPDMSWAKNLK